jgi:hypothetical protein
MSGGEESAIRVTRSLDGWRYCLVHGCDWRVADGECCQEHGGHPAAEMRTDEWGNVETHADHPPIAWEPWD